ncbi:hypothetical protein POM88_029108 [Heracleum sosnowskyi]|uniref:Ubiquitin-like protease family profile domain-containing protein n=1 Tax=Heracleum sosnowskyi TaxID=360622 RepID=A0AAD8MEK5_9APIA|nr:hypothetical protein POM88_029108 [Heracleum sosnowskyi]
MPSNGQHSSKPRSRKSGFAKAKHSNLSCYQMTNNTNNFSMRSVLEKDKLTGTPLASKGLVTHVKRTQTPLALLGDDTSLSEHCRSLRFLLNKRTSVSKDVVFKYVGTLCSELNENKFAFMLPSRLSILSKRDYQRANEAADYMKTILTANKEMHFILALYVQDNHWMLLLFSLKETVIYVFDSLKQARDIRLRTPVQTAFKLYTPQGGLKNNRKEFLIIHTEAQCPQQKGGTECGFFVMRYMHDIIMHS